MRKLMTTTAALTTLSLAAISGAAEAKVPCPNGRIALDRVDPASGNQFIFTSNPDGSVVRQLVLVPGSGPSWSHDGRKLAFTALAPDGRITTATADADGSDYTLLPIDDPTLNGRLLRRRMVPERRPTCVREL